VGAGGGGDAALVQRLGAGGSFEEAVRGPPAGWGRRGAVYSERRARPDRSSLEKKSLWAQQLRVLGRGGFLKPPPKK
jgi:hypothetical protein